jgi:hypothetical protein
MKSSLSQSASRLAGTPLYISHNGICTADEDAGEKIGISRIKLKLPVCGVTAVVSEFSEADRTLSTWNRALKLVHACEYAVLFTDGVSIRGKFSLSSKAKTLPSLTRIIQASLGLIAPTRGYLLDCVLVARDGTALSISSLENYSLNKQF